MGKVFSDAVDDLEESGRISKHRRRRRFVARLSRLGPAEHTSHVGVSVPDRHAVEHTRNVHRGHPITTATD